MGPAYDRDMKRSVVLVVALVAAACGGTLLSTEGANQGSGTDAGSQGAKEGAKDSGTPVDATAVTEAGKDAKGPTEATPCSQPTECLILSRTCCGVCSKPSKGDMMAVHKDAASRIRNELCGGGAVPCPACATQSNPNLQAVCTANACDMLVVDESTLSDCSTDSDCQLRGADLCGCNGGQAIAVNKAGYSKYNAMVYGANAVCAADCDPAFPSNMVAICNTKKHCIAAMSF